jgi:hypothetical protein
MGNGIEYAGNKNVANQYDNENNNNSQDIKDSRTLIFSPD